jgi:hypothetical protein
MTVKDYKHLLIIARDAAWRLNQRQLYRSFITLSRVHSETLTTGFTQESMFQVLC